MVAVGFNLAADSLHEGPDVVRFVPVLGPPHGLQHLPMQEDFACILGQIGQYLELATGEWHVAAIQPRASSTEVHLEPVVAIRRQWAPRAGCDSPQQSADPGE